MDFLNPWWRGRPEEDPHIARWLAQPVRWVPSLLDEIPLEPFSLHFIYGLRQVGKTTLLKLLAWRLAERRDPRSIFYYTCDLLADHRELEEVLREIARLKRRWGVKTAVILLDEVTYPREWHRALKFHIDQGTFQDDVVIATGSVSMYAARQVEAFPGRRGGGRDFVLHPLSFGGFARLLGIPPGADVEAWRGRIEEALELYLRCGGMPRSVVSCVSAGRPDPAAEGDLLAALASDLARLRRSEAYVKRLLRAVLAVAPNPVSLASLAREAELGSHRLAFSYLALLENLLVVRQLHHVDPFTLQEDYRKPRKIHLTDPALYHAVARWTGARPPEPPALLEAAVAMHLARRHRVGHWRDSWEVDVVVPDLGLGVEVEWSGGGRGGRLGRISVRVVDRFAAALLMSEYT